MQREREHEAERERDGERGLEFGPARGRADGRAAPRTIAVALHGIEPATFERCALIRDWLDDHGVDRATLLVIPARDLHPVGERSPEMVGWLAERARAGDSIAQHGFQHDPLQRAPRRPRRRTGEFSHLDGDETRRAVNAGWRVLKLAGIEPDGFVAPAYAYTSSLRMELSRRFRWWADLLHVHRADGVATGPRAAPLAPAFSLAGAGVLGRAISPSLARAGALLPTSSLRVDLHPSDLDNRRHMLALERVLSRSATSRTAVTYRDLAGV